MKTRLNILYLEDNPRDAELVRDTLEQASLPCDLRIARNRAEFEAALAQTPFDLILSDYNLPNYDGPAALVLARQTQPCVPFILISGTVGEETAVDCVLRGATDYVLKQRLSRLVPALRRALAEAEEHRKRQEAEEAMRKREADLELAQQIGHIGSWELDPTLGALVWSKEVYRIFGCDPAAFAPTKEAFIQLVHADDRARVREAVAKSMRNGADYEVEHRIRRTDGTERVVHEKGRFLRDTLGKAVRLVGTVQDVTERKHAQERICEQAALLDQTNDAIIVRAMDGAITYWNRGAENMFGWAAQEMLGCNAKETMIPAAAREKLEDVERQVLEQGYWMGEMDYVTKTGQKVIGQARASLVRDAAGTPQSYLVLITDLTEHKKLEMQFLRAQRLEAVGTMAGGIAHDLNNILAPILMGAPLLRYVQTPTETAATLDAIESSAQRAAAVIRQLLTFSRGQSGQRIPLHLKHLLRDLRSIIRETFPKNITFTLSEAPDLWPLVVDPTQLHQVLLNLCINARDAMPEGGTLAVTTSNFQADDHYASMTTDARPGPYVLLKVSDTGTGIRPKDLDKIFDPFFTTKEVGRGTGLGLATVHRVVTGHGGFVRVRSKVGHGTTFDVYLPASPGAMASAEPSAPASLLAGHGELILVVDDEEPIRRITQRTLLRHGYRVATASDGADAVSVFAQYKIEVKAVLTDLMMPNLDGLGLAKVLAQMKPGLPVILSTGVGDDPERHQTFAELGRAVVSIMLTKPYTAAELLNALHAVLPAA